MRDVLRVLLASFALAATCIGCSNAPATGGCTSSRDCAAGQVCLDSHCASGGPDAGACGAGCECATDATCAASAPACVDGACVSGSCFFRAHDERCATGQTCDLTMGCIGVVGGDAGPRDDASSDAAAPLDSAATDAGPPDTGPRDAGPPDASPGSPLGGPCTGSADCAPVAGAPVMCATMEGGVDFPGGYCTVACSGIIGTGGCPTGSACVVAGSTFTGAFCAPTCRGDADCRSSEGYACVRPMRSLTTATTCLPPGV